jgi:hypothetical protein
MGGAMVGEDADAPQAASSRRRPGTGETGEAAEAQSDAGTFPPGAMLCGKCNSQALVLLDGCQTCLNCGYSKCG